MCFLAFFRVQLFIEIAVVVGAGGCDSLLSCSLCGGVALPVLIGLVCEPGLEQRLLLAHLLLYIFSPKPRLLVNAPTAGFLGSKDDPRNRCDGVAKHSPCDVNR